jgi:hypothetical protein
VHCATANYYDIIVDQGATLLRSIALKNSAKKPVTINGYRGRMQIREKTSSSSVVLLLTTENGGIEISGTSGSLLIIASPTQTSNLVVGKYVYDLEIEEISTEIVTKVIQGNLVVRPEVTR